MSKYVLPNSTNFIDYINKDYSKFKAKADIKETCDTSSIVKKLEATNYQAFLQQFINESTPYRGILLYHGLGTGKTFSALNVAEKMNRQVVVLLPASLKPRWIEEFEKVDPVKYGKPENYKSLDDSQKKIIDRRIFDLISEKYTFISHNAYNVADQLFALRKKEFQKTNEEGEGEFDSGYVVKRIGSLDNKLLIVDEIHNVLTNITSAGSKNGSRIYEMIMRAKGLKMLALTGTPVINDPFELAALFNMLRGPMYIEKDIFTAFPEDYTKFREYFVDPITYSIKNKGIFQERIAGLVSYVRGSNDENYDVYPKRVDHLVEVPMSLYQWKVYVKARQKEIEKEQRSKSFLGVKTATQKLKRPFPDSSVDFKTGSRAASNFVFPEELPKPPAMKPNESMKEFKERIDDTIKQLTKKDLVEQLGTFSPKYKYIIDFLNKNTKGLTIVYSDFLTLEGIGIFKKVLEYHGYTKYRADTGRDYYRYIEFSGDIDDFERTVSKAAFVDPDNKEGKNVRILLGTSAMAEGLDLKNVRNVIIMEPYFHNVVLKQVIGRAVRRCSHILLPYKERDVNVYLLVSTRPEGGNLAFPGNDKMTTDQTLLLRAKQKEKLNNSFLDAMKEIAVDCEINEEINKSKKNPIKCAVCANKNMEMYKPDIEVHMIKGNTHCIKEDLSITESITVNGIEYGIDNQNNLYDISVSPPKKVGRLIDNQPILSKKGSVKKSPKKSSKKSIKKGGGKKIKDYINIFFK